MARSTIMIVEDETIVAMELQDALESMNYRVTPIVRYGDKALEEAKKTKPDLVIMDIRLKGETDGIEAAANIREELGIPIVYLTAYADDKTLQRAKETQPFGYLLKPFTDAQLRTTIEITLHKSAEERKSCKTASALATTLSFLGGGAIILDEKGSITFINPIAQVLTGWKSDEAVGRSLPDVLTLKDKETGLIVLDSPSLDLKLRSIAPAEYFLLVSKHGAEIPISIRMIPIMGDSNQLTGAIVAFEDSAHEMSPDQDWFSHVANLCLSADLCRIEGEFAKAKAYYESALLSLVRHLGTDDPKVVRVVEDLRNVIKLMGNKAPGENL